MNVNRILHHKKAVAAIWILLILFPNPALLPLNVYRFFEMPTRPTNDVQLVADSLPANATAIERYVDSHIHYAYDFQAYGAVWYFPPPATFSKHSKETVSRKPSYLQACLKRNRFRTQSRSLPCISGSTTTANCEPTLPSNTKQLRLPSLKMANSSSQTRQMRYSI